MARPAFQQTERPSPRAIGGGTLLLSGPSAARLIAGCDTANLSPIQVANGGGVKTAAARLAAGLPAHRIGRPLRLIGRQAGQTPRFAPRVTL
jgi:hypothetical protein